MGFEGEYAEFKAKDEQGLYYGLINRKGEVVWNDGLRHPILKVRNHPNVFFSIKCGNGVLLNKKLIVGLNLDNVPSLLSDRYSF